VNKKIISWGFFAIAAYGIFVILIMFFYDDSPDKMKWDDREEYNRQFIAQIQLNQFTFEHALENLGSPDITEAKQVEGNRFQVMFYRTQHVKSDGITTQDECTFLLFINGNLKEIGLGHNYPKNWGIINSHKSLLVPA